MAVTDEKTSSDSLSGIYEAIEKKLPKKSKIEVEKEKTNKKKITEYNKAVIQTYLESEATHLEQQKPVGVIIAISVIIQLIAFNVLIYLVVLGSHDLEKTQILLDFMKYYIGAVIAEMLAMCWFVIRGIYSGSIKKMAEHILSKKGDNK